MILVYFPTFTIKIHQMYVNIPYMDPMGRNYIRIYIYEITLIGIIHARWRQGYNMYNPPWHHHCSRSTPSQRPGTYSKTWENMLLLWRFCLCVGIFFTRCWVFPKELLPPSKPYDSGLTFLTFVVGTHGKTRQMRTKNQGAEGSEPFISWWPNLGVPRRGFVALESTISLLSWRSGKFCSWLSWRGTVGFQPWFLTLITKVSSVWRRADVVPFSSMKSVFDENSPSRWKDFDILGSNDLLVDPGGLGICVSLNSGCRKIKFSNLRVWCMKYQNSLRMGDRSLYNSICTQKKTGWWFEQFIIFTLTWGRFPIWLIFFMWVETTN